MPSRVWKALMLTTLLARTSVRAIVKSRSFSSLRIFRPHDGVQQASNDQPGDAWAVEASDDQDAGSRIRAAACVRTAHQMIRSVARHISPPPDRGTADRLGG